MFWTKGYKNFDYYCPRDNLMVSWLRILGIDQYTIACREYRSTQDFAAIRLPPLARGGFDWSLVVHTKWSWTIMPRMIVKTHHSRIVTLCASLRLEHWLSDIGFVFPRVCVFPVLWDCSSLDLFFPGFVFSPYYGIVLRWMISVIGLNWTE